MDLPVDVICEHAKNWHLDMFVMFGAQWAPGRAHWALTLSPEPTTGPV